MSVIMIVVVEWMTMGCNERHGIGKQTEKKQDVPRHDHPYDKLDDRRACEQVQQ